MLQQTQVARVLVKYGQFLASFPTVHALTAAPTADVLAAWSGLGYNRRALSLHRTAKIVLELHEGRIPTSPEELRLLPGIGPATAAAVCVFAFGRPHAFIETNIRSAFIHFFFQGSDVGLRRRHPPSRREDHGSERPPGVVLRSHGLRRLGQAGLRQPQPAEQTPHDPATLRGLAPGGARAGSPGAAIDSPLCHRRGRRSHHAARSPPRAGRSGVGAGGPNRGGVLDKGDARAIGSPDPSRRSAAARPTARAEGRPLPES